MHIFMQPLPLARSRNFSSSQTESLYPLIQNSPISPLPAPCSHHSTLSLKLTALDSSYKWNHTYIYLSLCVWFISLGIMSSSFIHVVAYWRPSFLSFYSIPLCVYTIIYLFICQWIYRLFPYFDYYEYCWNKYGSVNTSLRFWFQSFWINNQKCDCVIL